MTREIFIGDIQGHYDGLASLLEKLRFDPSRDQLRLAGDLVNRGGQSLETLRLIRSLGDRAMTVLGNHDLHLLAYAWGVRRRQRGHAEFDAILDAGDGRELLDWLCRQPLMWASDRRRLALVHAGVDPRWSPDTAKARAAELESALAADPRAFFEHMYGDHPKQWQPDQPEKERLRAITNVLTRMRFCSKDGILDLDYKGDPDHAPDGVSPWFRYLHAAWADWTIVFGHWSMLGCYREGQVICLDSGCVWGGELTALVLEEGRKQLVAVECERRRRPG
ncbi:symmetrical bis(5'-nucleosyl)-tetraphosphatase [Wenzhouxiangella sp. AB-CW3]|uniref:symmetrical bis(5'-nucleosyl)-tetraphosphatase n=1 Tax=Wenzhouxiangella sp. AB-CW3 TaxID=2771012 RepID=UPI00168A68E1|nr:symmetrical bis(5'-nucleosyl)-tetraphosphatase [Wenzhouxiangella sp. AB-CW3]QOC22340.1 symmetrical bis(5'-nucleosyl)-tetraphosphatase [Wenzhouxiangella sp. AB-CW3]